MKPVNAGWIVVLVSFLVNTPVFSQKEKEYRVSKVQTNDLAKNINANNISYWISNKGSGATRENGQGAQGLNWPKGSSWSGMYIDGFTLVGTVRLPDGKSDLRAVGSYYRTSFQAGSIIQPGKVENGKYTKPIADNPTSPENRIYKIQKNLNDIWTSESEKISSIKDYNEWPISNGAPTDSDLKPLHLGDQTLFYTANDMDSIRARGNLNSTSIGLEMQTTVWEYQSTFFEDVVYIQRKFINKSGLPIDSVYFSIYADSDLDNGGGDIAGSDSVLGMIYNYKSTSSNYVSDKYPTPGVSFVFLETPLKSGNNPTEKAIVNRKLVSGKSNLGMTAVFGLLKSVNNYDEFYNTGNIPQQVLYYSTGRNKTGTPQVDHEGKPTMFAFSGDPISKTGDLFELHWGPHDTRSFGTTGPFNMAPGDTQTISYAIIVAKGNTNLEAVPKLKKLAKTVKEWYPFMEIKPDSVIAETKVVGSNLFKVLTTVYAPDNADYTSIQADIRNIQNDEKSPEFQLVKKSGSGVQWKGELLTEGRQFPSLLNYTFNYLGQNLTTELKSQQILLRRYPEVDSIQILAESGVQDKKLNVEEFGYLRLFFSNPDSVFPITSLKTFFYDGFYQTEKKSYSFSKSTPFYLEYKYGSGAKIGDSLIVGFNLEIDGYLKSYNIGLPLLQYTQRMKWKNILFSSQTSDADQISISIADQTLLTGHNYKIDFHKVDHSIRWRLTDLDKSELLADSLSFTKLNYGGFNFYSIKPEDWVFDGIGFMTRYEKPGFLSSSVAYMGWVDDYDPYTDSWITNLPKFLKSKIIEPEDYASIRIDYSGNSLVANPATWSKAYMYKLMPDSSWQFLGIGDVPFKVWDTSHNRQMNVCIRDDGDLIWNMGWNGTTFPNDFGNNEHIMIMNSTYNANGVYDNLTIGPNEDVMYYFRPKRRTLNSKYLQYSFSISKETKNIYRPGDYLTFKAPKAEPIPGYKNEPLIFFKNNFPNPFNPSTTIQFELGKDFGQVSLVVYNLLGQQVKVLKNGSLKQGYYDVVWDGKNENGNYVSSGVYFYRLSTEGFSQTKKMIMLK